jgi:hypothetical protein
VTDHDSAQHSGGDVPPTWITNPAAFAENLPAICPFRYQDPADESLEPPIISSTLLHSAPEIEPDARQHAQFVRHGLLKRAWSHIITSWVSFEYAMI